MGPARGPLSTYLNFLIICRTRYIFVLVRVTTLLIFPFRFNGPLLIDAMSIKHSGTHPTTMATACQRSLLVVVLLVVVLAARESTAYSSGGTSSACGNGIPGGGLSKHGTQQSGRGGYTVQYSPALSAGKTFSTGVTYQSESHASPHSAVRFGAFFLLLLASTP